MLFRCKNCGGNVIYSPEKGDMFCPHCDGIDSGEKEVSEEKDICVNCGAPLEMKEYNSTCKCEYCESYIIIDERVRGEYELELVLPFQIGMEQAVEMMKKEFRKRIFTPGTFLKESTLKEMKGMYVPYWMYDYDADCTYIGNGTKVRVWTSGDTEYTETSYFRVVRKMAIDFQKVPVDASIEMPDDVMDLMEPFDYGVLKDFQEKYMSGFYGEIYNQNSEELEERAQQKVKKDAECMLQETLGGYTTLASEKKDIRMNTRRARYALLPVWRYIYKYRDKEYPFYVNGQTGKIVGSTPVEKKKVLSYGGTVFVLVWMILYLVARIAEIA